MTKEQLIHFLKTKAQTQKLKGNFVMILFSSIGFGEGNSTADVPN